MTDAPLKVWLDRDGRLLRLRLARPKANIVDAAMIEALGAALTEHAGRADLSAVLLDHEGPHFSFGASVEEHLPGQCDAMLKGLHALLKKMLSFPAPILVAIKGQCLGGGLEVALAGNVIFAAPDAKMGQPEIKVGVFAPAASCLLPPRVGQSRAEDMLYSGRAVAAQEAHAIGLADHLADDPEAAALDYFDKYVSTNSAAVQRFAVRAVRADYVERMHRLLDQVETLYLSELMNTHDAVEGLNAFLAKRPAKWENR